MQELRPPSARVITAMIAAGLLGVAGCSATTSGEPVSASGFGESASTSGQTEGPDVSTAGQLDYACALGIDAAETHGPVEDWELAIGDDAGPALFQVAGATGLLGAQVGAHLKDHRELSDAAATVLKGLTRIDTEVMQQGLDELVAGCQDQQLPAGQPDVTPDGQVDYACALATDVATAKGPIESWYDGIGDEADPALHELAGAAGLLGALTASHLADHGKLSDAASEVYEGMVRVQPEHMQQGLDALVEGCSAR